MRRNTNRITEQTPSIRAERRHPCVPVDDLSHVPCRLPDPLPPVDPEQVQSALDELPKLFRTPIILYYFDDFSYRDMAEQMDLPLGTVMSRLARAKAYLRSRLLPEVTAVGAVGPGGGPNGL